MGDCAKIWHYSIQALSTDSKDGPDKTEIHYRQKMNTGRCFMKQNANFQEGISQALSTAKLLLTQKILNH